MTKWGEHQFFETAICISCSVQFGVPFGFIDNRREDKGKFFCPNGHEMSYRESEADKLRRERDRLKQSVAQKDDEIAAQRRRTEEAERQASAARAAKSPSSATAPRLASAPAAIGTSPILKGIWPQSIRRSRQR